MSEIKNIQIKPRPLQAVQFTGDNAEWVRDWIQSHIAFQKVTVTPERLYLPTFEGVDILEVGDWVLYDPEDGAFRGAQDGAIQAHYVEIEE